VIYQPHPRMKFNISQLTRYARDESLYSYFFTTSPSSEYKIMKSRILNRYIMFGRGKRRYNYIRRN